MNSTRKWIISIGTSFSLALAAGAVSAQPNPMHGGMQHGMRGGEQQSMHGGKQHGKHEGKGAHGSRQSEHSPQAAQHLMTPEERTALQEKMRSAKTPEERQQIATATRTEMENRAKGKGIALSEHRGPRGRHGSSSNTTAPATTEHAH